MLIVYDGARFFVKALLVIFQSLSQGDSAAFQKSVKVLGYQMRIMMSLIDSFVDYIIECETHVVKLLIVLQR